MEKKRLKANVAPLISHYLPNLAQPAQLQILDLACGGGRNGLWFAQQGANVTFIDKDISNLPKLLPHCHALAYDLEDGSAPALPVHEFDIVLVFNYLHRPLFEQIKHCVKPEGLLIYETFTTEQAKVGRPKNPAFLLQADELLTQFDEFDILHYFEGNVGCEDEPIYKAQFIGQKRA
ncbi:class I SAM-dependent methyltransferase [Shewanella algidipiscicola]|uniref:Type 12 methyltransferase n=1 Tax=Shewanella algidipiscicola TaxID=614070 RepID=A0ABQ4PA12_9GAMM|nr:class I SAM-dependent methyltransferase [Shewanella algidipiscicola]GIU44365.1 type 12 methyltransferase [Shewanella algidipiscicola]